MRNQKLITIIICLLAMVFANSHLEVSNVSAQSGGTYYVATDGNDTTDDGSEGNPWATISYALQGNKIPDDSLILVKPGTYTERINLRGQFTNGITIRSQVPYMAKLRNNDQVVYCYYGQGITLEGFDIAHSGSGSGALVIQIQDLNGGADQVSRITLRNNILHDSYNNDILKVNNNATDILIEGNMFFNQEGSDEHIDVNSVTNVVIQDNVFFNDFSASGRTNNNNTSSYIVIKDSNENSDGQLGSENITVRRNVFLNWEGSTGQGFVRLGEDGQNFYEVDDALIENNLMIGNSSNKIRSPLQFMNVANITARANTIVGNMPALEYGARVFTYGTGAPNNNQIHLHNNIWADPTGTMSDTFNRGNNTNNLTFDNNLFWNNNNPFPTSSESIIEVTDDANRIVDNPLLGNQSGLVVPHWDGANFADGSSTIREAFEQLVNLYGTPATGSPAINNADPANAPTEDILGNTRTTPDIGAVEFVPALTLQARPDDETLYLTWTVNTTLPAATTWRITYYTNTASPLTATDPLSTTRAYTLTGLSNYTRYTVTLEAMLSTTPFLTDTIQATPTDIFVYLPVIIKD